MPVVAWSLWRTSWGLRLRACGESPLAALTEGVPVRRFRYGAMLLCGALAGSAGAFFSLIKAFVEEITAGRGFIGLAIVIRIAGRPAGQSPDPRSARQAVSHSLVPWAILGDGSDAA